jgi:hypothetical protein
MYNSSRLTHLCRAVISLGAVVLSFQASAQIAVRNQGYVPFSDAPINYRSDDLHDPVADLQAQIDKGAATLQYEPEHGYLRSVLNLLNIPIYSQTLVFSKTSFQYPKISPEHPRALYFNDDVYVGAVHDGKAIEVVSFDAMQGAIFYLLDERKSNKPAFQRAELDCTQCHIAAGTRGVPGVLLRSVYPLENGTLAIGKPSYITDQNSPFNERWGGWYVTGKLPDSATLANAAIDSNSLEGSTSAGPVPTALRQRFDASTYLSPGSDVVAQLVLAHQTQMHNLITLTNYKTRQALYTHEQKAAADAASATSPDAPTPLSDEERRGYEQAADQLLQYLLFAQETPLNGNGAATIQSSSFATQFSARGRRDPKGRSLRDFDLSERIFRYPCSYLIYSEAFDRLPEPARAYVYHRLLQVLTGQDQSPAFARLTAADRQAVLEILMATKPGLPPEWEAFARSQHLKLASVGPSPTGP